MPGQGVTRQPLNLTVNRIKAIRAGSYPGPYSIINTSLTETIWVANNPAVAEFQGTSVSPGTSLTWTPIGGSDLFVIMGTPVSSSTAAIIISFDTLGWQPNPVAIAVSAVNTGSILVEHETVLFAGTILGASVESASPQYDITKANSLMLIGNANVVSVYVTFNIYFFDVAGILIDSLQMSFVSSTNSDFSIQIPCIGAFVGFAAGSSADNGSVSFRAVASQRQIPGISQSLAIGTGALMRTGITGVAANNQLTLGFIPPWFGLINIVAELRGAGTIPSQVFLILQNLDGLNGSTTGYMTWGNAANDANGSANVDGSGAFQLNQQFANWGNQIQVAAFNHTALTGISISIVVQPVRNNP